MKNKKFIPLIAMAAVVCAFATREAIVHSQTVTQTPQVQAITVPVPPAGPTVTHKQLIWIYLLENCESGGNQGAINPKDSDGTPSYYSFQWKPGTFRGFSLKYLVLPLSSLDTTEKVMTEMRNYDTQFTLLEHMVNDPTVNFHQQFPHCTDTIGLPPKA